jgi:hypothetical protein
MHGSEGREGAISKTFSFTRQLQLLVVEIIGRLPVGVHGLVNCRYRFNGSSSTYEKKKVIFNFLIGIALVAFVAFFGQVYLVLMSTPSASTSSASPSASPMPPTSPGVVEEIVSNLEWGNIAFDTPINSAV